MKISKKSHAKTMKATEKKKFKKSKGKNKPIPKQKVMIVAQEVKFARLLSGNEKKTRDRVLKALKKWLKNCFVKGYEFKENDFIRVWKGLFYAMWMSDKPLVQEELCESIAGILDEFPVDQFRHALMMMKAGFQVLATEWYGLDQHRMDKFLMLVRRVLRACLRCVARADWSTDHCEMFSDMLLLNDGLFASPTPAYARNALSLLLHISDCFIEELAKVSKSTIPDEAMVSLLRAFACHMCAGADVRAAAACRRVFTQLLRHSEPAREGEEATRAWEQMGCPEGGPEALQKVSDDEDGEEPSDDDNSDVDDDDGALDPRAGRVNVSLAPLPVPAAPIAAMLRGLMKGCSGAAHTRVKMCAQRFEQLAAGCNPLPPRDLGIEDYGTLKTPKPTKVAKKLARLERELVEGGDELEVALKGIPRKQRKRLLARSREGHSIADELAALARRPPDNCTTNGGWQVEEAEPTKKHETANKDNADKKSKKRKQTDQVDSPSKKQKHEEKHRKNKENKSKDKQMKVKIIVKDKNDGKRPKLESPKKSPKVKIVITDSPKKEKKTEKTETKQESPKRKKKQQVKKDLKTSPLLAVNKVKNFQKQTSPSKKDKKVDKKTNKTDEKTPEKKADFSTPKKVKFVLKYNSHQKPVDYYKSVRQSPNIPYDSSKKPTKTNLKPNSTPSPINPFFKKKLRLKK